jgi:hypothetical protein
LEIPELEILVYVMGEGKHVFMLLAGNSFHSYFFPLSALKAPSRKHSNLLISAFISTFASSL